MPSKNDDRKQVVLIGLAAISFLIGISLLKLSGISTSFVVTFSNTFLSQALLDTQGLSTIQSLGVVLSPFALVVLGFLSFVAGFAALATYGFFDHDPKYALASGAIAALGTILVFSPLLGVFVGIGLVGASYLVPHTAALQSRELKTYVRFRSGSRAVSQGLFILNIFLTIGVFIAVLNNQYTYGALFKEQTIDTMTTIALASVPPIQGADLLIRSQIVATVGSSPIFDSYVRWIPVVSAISVWFFFELLRSLLFSFVGGLLTSVSIRIANSF